MPPTEPLRAQSCPPTHCAQCRWRTLDAFVPITPDELAHIEKMRCAAPVVPARTTLIHEKQPITRLYTLYSGWAFRYKSLSDGRRQILNFLLPGDLIGLQQEFEGDALHGVETVTDVSLCEFQRDQLWSLYRDHPRMGYAVTWMATREGAYVDDNLLTVGKRSAMERIAMLLMHLYRRMELLGLVDDGSTAFPINQQHVADALGLSLVHTNKTLRRLTALGLHQLRDGRLYLMNPRALQSVADYYDAPRGPVPLL